MGTGLLLRPVWPQKGEGLMIPALCPDFTKKDVRRPEINHSTDQGKKLMNSWVTRFFRGQAILAVRPSTAQAHGQSRNVLCTKAAKQTMRNFRTVAYAYTTAVRVAAKPASVSPGKSFSQHTPHSCRWEAVISRTLASALTSTWTTDVRKCAGTQTTGCLAARTMR